MPKYELKVSPQTKNAIIAKLNSMVDSKRPTLEVKVTRFLETNKRIDRDALIRKREEIRILNALKRELFQ